MIGGISNPVISNPLSAPPASPRAIATAAATTTGSPPSRHAAPKTTAASPIIDPTERSMPPVIMTGVSANASNPNSTLRRITSKKFAAEKKFSPRAENTATSSASATSSTHSPLGNHRSRQGLRSLAGKSSSSLGNAVAQAVDCDCGENDPALDRALPVGADGQEGEGWTGHSQQHHSEQRAQHGSLPAGHRRASHDDRGNYLHLHAESSVARHLVEAHGIEQCRRANQRTGQSEDAEHDARRVDPRQAGGRGIRAGGINRPTGREISQSPCRRSRQYGRRHHGESLAEALRLPEPLKASRQVLHPGAFGDPTQPVAQRDHGSERDHDRGNPRIRYQRAVQCTEQRTRKTRDKSGEWRRQSQFGRRTSHHAADRELRAH